MLSKLSTTEPYPSPQNKLFITKPLPNKDVNPFMKSWRLRDLSPVSCAGNGIRVPLRGVGWLRIKAKKEKAAEKPQDTESYF